MTHSYPHFLVVGMMKAATTTIYEYLAGHPKVIPAISKELHYFTRDYGVKIDKKWWGMEYKEMLNVREDDDSYIYGEASPSYIDVPERISYFNPKCKIIISLRDPLARAISQIRQYNGHNHLVPKEGFFEELIDAKNNNKIENLNYVRDSNLYASRINRFLDVFDENDVCIISYEKFIEDVQGVMNELFSFLGLSSIIVNKEVRGAATESFKMNNEDEISHIISSAIDKTRGKSYELLKNKSVKLIPNNIEYFAKY